MTTNKNKNKNKNKEDEIEVIERTGDVESYCAGCGLGILLSSGSRFKKEGENGFCLKCAGLNHLVFLPSGNPTLTRRASKYSSVKAIVKQINLTYKGYERIGILVEEVALQKAREECIFEEKNPDIASSQKSRKQDKFESHYIETFSIQIQSHYPSCSKEDVLKIAAFAYRNYLGKTRPSFSFKKLNSENIDLAVRIHVLHYYTNYSELHRLGRDTENVRNQLLSTVNEIIGKWKIPIQYDLPD
jgi:hypothetical protein